MRIHFIAVGGSVMHGLAIELHKAGHQITGSDDKIYEPSRSRLARYGLLPQNEGWNPELISPELDCVIVGMHARADNPELLKAKQLGIPVLSFPEFFRQYCQDKQRIVIAGSHGKTTIASMVLHVLTKLSINPDFLLGATPEGYENSVKLSDSAAIVVIEGDEYATSPLDSSPKFLHYGHHIGVISGIAWDHFNIYPSFEGYLDSFRRFAEQTPKAGFLIYNAEDDTVVKAMKKWETGPDVTLVPYSTPKHKIENGILYLITESKLKIPMKVFGRHNLSNIAAAMEVCKRIRISEDDFINAISNFKGAPNRLELVGENNNTKIFRDFAHAPSKLEATVKAVREQFPRHKLVACYELHTFSSLNREFLQQYRGKFKDADLPIVFFDPKTVESKKLPPLSASDIRNSFGMPNLKVITNVSELESFLLSMSWASTNLLLMSSGNFAGMDIQKLTRVILG